MHVPACRYELFFLPHHMFIVFFTMLLLHGPVYWMWAMVPISMYIVERAMRLVRGNRPYSVQRVEWIPPVMAVQFRPHEKEDFPLREGQARRRAVSFVSSTPGHVTWMCGCVVVRGCVGVWLCGCGRSHQRRPRRAPRPALT